MRKFECLKPFPNGPEVGTVLILGDGGNGCSYEREEFNGFLYTGEIEKFPDFFREEKRQAFRPNEVEMAALGLFRNTTDCRIYRTKRGGRTGNYIRVMEHDDSNDWHVVDAEGNSVPFWPESFEEARTIIDAFQEK